MVNLVAEFSNTKRTSEIGVSWEFHEQSRISFQKEFLVFAFKVALGILQETMHLAKNQQSSPYIFAMFQFGLQLLLQVLSWDFSTTQKYHFVIC